jgi:hypothetical protein
MLQWSAFQVLHRDEGAARIFPDVVNGADVGMIQRGGGLGFTAETLERIRIVGEILWKELESDMAIEAGIHGFVVLATVFTR